MYNKKRRGPDLDPWGLSRLVEGGEEEQFPAWTCNITYHERSEP